MASIIVAIHVLLFGSVYSNTCESFNLNKDNLDQTLTGHSVLEINDMSHHECARTCLSFAICKSIDYNRIDQRCKLNDVDRSSTDPLEFSTKKGSIFSDISEWPSVSKKKYFYVGIIYIFLIIFK